MKKNLNGLIMLLMLVCLASPAAAQVSIGIGLPNVSIGINLPIFPELVRVPGYPVYYAPRMDANYFFYDGMYWVYQDDYWYASSWYNGPWGIVQPEVVPLYILRIPVRYYRQPPVYFREWQSNAPPRWGQHWGRGWEQQHRGWDNWNRRSAPAPAPLPVYQRKYSGERYPSVEQQHSLRSQSYRYQPRDKVVRQHFQQVEHNAPPAAQRQQNDQRLEQRKQQREQQLQKQQNDQRQQQQKQQTDQRQKQLIQQREQQYQKRQNDLRQQHDQQQQKQQQQRQQIDPRQQQQQQRQQIDQRQQQQKQQPAPRVQEREQRPQERGVTQEPGRDRGAGQNRDEERGRGRDK